MRMRYFYGASVAAGFATALLSPACVSIPTYGVSADATPGQDGSESGKDAGVYADGSFDVGSETPRDDAGFKYRVFLSPPRVRPSAFFVSPDGGPEAVAESICTTEGANAAAPTGKWKPFLWIDKERGPMQMLANVPGGFHQTRADGTAGAKVLNTIGDGTTQATILRFPVTSHPSTTAWTGGSATIAIPSICTDWQGQGVLLLGDISQGSWNAQDQADCSANRLGGIYCFEQPTD